MDKHYRARGYTCAKRELCSLKPAREKISRG